MPNLKEVKTRIQSVVSTQQITKAMKMVAAAKLRRAQDKILGMRPYANRLNEVLQNVSAGGGLMESNEFGGESEEQQILIVAISSDRGLCGAFNSNVGKMVISLIGSKYKTQYQRGNVTILPLGKKAYDYFRKREFNVIDLYYEIFHDLNFETSSVISNYIMKKYKEGVFDKVEVVYNEFKNVATQVMRAEQYLPIQPPAEDAGDPVEFIFEPDQDFIIREMIPNSLRVQLYKSLLESNAAEHGARMTAMDQATENAGDLLSELRQTYNQTRQAAITKEILEIVAGADALGG